MHLSNWLIVNQNLGFSGVEALDLMVLGKGDDWFSKVLSDRTV